MSSTASRMAARSAGRGATLRPKSSNHVPVTQLRSKKVPHSGAGRGSVMRRGHDPTPPQSTFSAAILNSPNSSFHHNQSNNHRNRRSSNSPRRNNAHAPKYEFENQTYRKQQNNSRYEDWFTSTARAEALESFNSPSITPTQNDQRSEHVPFGWIDLTAVVKDIPEGHWATGYMQGVARSLENNRTMSGKDKEKVLTEVLDSLKSLSDNAETDQRFEDA